MSTRSYAAPVLFVAALVSCAVYSTKPPVEGDRAVALAYVQAWNSHDTVAIDTLLAGNGVQEDIPRNFRAAGAKAVNEFMRRVVRTDPDFRWTVTNSMEEGRYVGLEWTWTSSYTGRDPSGKQVSNRRTSGRGASIVEVDDGKIKRFTNYYDTPSFFR